MIVPPKITQSHSVSCSQCGGVAGEVPGTRYLQCAYCQSLVFPHGSPLETDNITPLGQELESICPCCSEPLQTGKIDGHNALYCRRCYGILIRNRSFGTVVCNRRSARGRTESQEARPIDPDEYKRSLHCPGCQGRMETHPYYGPGNVVIDSCCDCSYVWLDHGELASVARADRRPVHQSTAPVPHPTITPQSLPPTEHEESPLQALFDLLF